MNNRFWEKKSLAAMSAEEWELLCDGCGRCCLNKLEDEDTGEIFYTNVACHLLDIETCQCKDYGNRFEKVPGCLKVEINEATCWFDELPANCAYHLLALNKKLNSWHPLISGNDGSIHEAGASVKSKVVSEEFIHQDQLEEHIITWEPMIFPGGRNRLK